MSNPSPYPDEVLFGIAEYFLEKKEDSVKAICAAINADLRPDPPINRQSVYKMLRFARNAGYLRFRAPIVEEFEQQIADKFALDPKQVHVVNTLPQSTAADVSSVAAEIALERLKRLRHLKGPVGIGLGPGRATREFCRHFSSLVASEHGLPKINLFAISAGCPPENPDVAPVSFFNLFPEDLIMQRRALFAEPLIRSEDYPKLKGTLGLREAFKDRDSIRIIATSMGDIDDEHDLLRRLLLGAGVNPKKFERERWIGNVQFRPYSQSGPIRERASDLRVATLFELDELADVARSKEHHVILMARRCGLCKMTRARALRPLISQKGLRVFSEVVMDVATARDLLDS